MMLSIDKNNSDFTIQNILSSGKDLSELKEFINFTVSNNAGDTVSVNVNRKETLENLQAIIQNQCGIPLNEQIFSCFGESTLLNGNDGMQQTFNDLNEIRVNVQEMKDDSQNNKAQQKIDELSNQISKLTKEIAELIAQSPICRIEDLEDKYEKAQQRIYELEAKKAENETKNNRINCEVNDETNAQNFEQQKDLAQESETEVCQNQITKLTKANAELIDPSPICIIKDIRDINREIDYERLNGKILEVNRLEYWSQRKWLADNIGISFKNSGFLVYPKELRVVSHSNISANIINRIVCNNLQDLYLNDITITYSDYKKLTASQKLDHLRLEFITVMDENGKKVEIDKLLKETKYVATLYYSFNDGEVTSETAQKLAEPPFPNLRMVSLSNVPESFDIKTFYKFLKKNSTIFCCSLWFECSTKFYEEIKRAQNDLLQTLPSTCKLIVNKLS